MTDFLIQMGLSNACFSLALATVAMVVGARAKRPYLAHMLWLLVFVKLVTPPVVTIPVGMPALAASPDDLPAEINLPVVSELDVQAQPAAIPAAPPRFVWSNISAKLHAVKPWLASIWLLGSLFVFAWSVRRVFQFIRLLQQNTEPAPHQLQTAADTIAKQLKLNTLPSILTTSAHLSPMVWWAGGKVRVVIPASLLDEMEISEWRWVLAHELAHVRRRDYLVRWLEWLACVCFWWNPVVWWAQRNLRAMEEICCDALVLSCLQPKPRSYANSLLTAVEFFACPAIRPPAMVCEVNSGGFLERRFRMIVQETPNRVSSRWLQACVLLCAVVVLPLGLAYGQDHEAVGKRLRAAVEAGELTGEQARVMLGALKQAEGGDKDQAADRAKAYLMNVKKKLGAAVEAGKISKEDAVKRYEGAEKAVKERMAAGRGERGSKRVTRADYARVEAELRKLVAEGKLTEKEARAKLVATRKMIWQKSERDTRETTRGDRGGESDKDVDWGAIRKRIEGAVKAGKMTREQADEAYNGFRKRMAQGGERERGERDRGDWIQEVLKEKGKLADRQIRPTLVVLDRVIHELKNWDREHDVEFELSTGLEDYLEEEAGLDADQIELVVGIARRVFDSEKETDRER